MTVWASDGFNTTMADSPVFQVTRKPPIVALSAPTAGAVLNLFEPVGLSGMAMDLEGGSVEGPGLVWRSDRQGVIGTGSQWFLPGQSLDPGWHTLSLTASDSDGQMAVDSVRVLIGYALHLPVILSGYTP